ncbi:WD40 repeat-like protein [Suillus weaverae]|nr:WD40 repeat-like protein [Suillus weaverae]
MAARLFGRPTPREASTPAQSNRPTPKNKFEIRGKRIRDFVFLHDNIHVVGGSEDGTMRKWDCDTGLTVGKPLKSKGGRMYALALSPDGKTIACGRADGSVQQLNTDGKMMLQSVWRGQSNWVRSLSWSPSGSHIASGSFDGEMLIRKVESGGVEVGPIKTRQVGVSALAFSPSGERIASGGYNSTICIWNTKTGKLAVGPIKNLWNSVIKSGALLYSLEHDHILFSVALSPKNNVLACVGSKGVAQLWDTESYQPLGQPFHDHISLRHVTFSRDGNHLAYCGMDGAVTLWMVKDMAPELEAPTLPQQGHGQLETTQQPKGILPKLQQRTRPQSPSSSCLDADATGGDGITEEVRDDPYNNFFQLSQTSLPATTASPPQPPNPSSAQRLWKIISQSVPLRECYKHKFLAWRACSDTSLEPAITTPNQPTPDWKLRAKENDKASAQYANCPSNAGLGANKLEADGGKQREGSLTNAQSSLAKLNGNIWKWPMRVRGKDPTSVSMAPRAEVVEVFAVRGFQRYIVSASKHKMKSSAVTCSTPIAVAHMSGSSQPTPSSPARQGEPSSPGIVAHGTRHLQAVGAHTLPSQFVTTDCTNHDSDSRSSIEGSCNSHTPASCITSFHVLMFHSWIVVAVAFPTGKALRTETGSRTKDEYPYSTNTGSTMYFPNILAHLCLSSTHLSHAMIHPTDSSVREVVLNTTTVAAVPCYAKHRERVDDGLMKTIILMPARDSPRCSPPYKCIRLLTQTTHPASHIATRKASGPKYKFEGHKDTIWSLVFLHDNVHIVSGSLDGTMRKWNCDTGRLVGKPWKGKGGDITALGLSPDGKTVACGRADWSVQQWTTNGKMISDWRDHSKAVRSVSWSPNGKHIASGSDDGTILIRKAGSGEVEVGPIETRMRHWDGDREDSEVWSLSYSPSGDRIASGCSNFTISIWSTTTGKRVVSPIRDLGNVVTSLVWSSDSTRLYSASDKFARVFDSNTGELLHRYTHNDDLYSVALSPKNNVLACVGWVGIAQLWNTESHHQLRQSFRQDPQTIRSYGGYDGKLTLWMVNDIAPELAHQPESPSSRLDADAAKSSEGDGSIEGVQGRRQGTEEARPESPSSSFLNVDATGGDVIIEGVRDDPYNNFFQSSQISLPATTSGPPQPSSARRLWNMISRHRSPADESVSRERPKRSFFSRRARSKSPLEPAATTPSQPTLQGNVLAGEDEHQGERDDNSPSTKGPALSAELDREVDRNLWRRLMGARGKDTTSVNIAPATQRPKVVDVYAVRGFQRYIASPKRWKKSSAVTCGAPLASAHISNSSQSGPSSQAGSAQAGALLRASSGQGGPSSPAIHGTQYLQVVEGPSSHTSGSHFVTTYRTNHDSDSRSSIDGSCNRFLDKICFPRGHYH